MGCGASKNTATTAVTNTNGPTKPAALAAKQKQPIAKTAPLNTKPVNAPIPTISPQALPMKSMASPITSDTQKKSAVTSGGFAVATPVILASQPSVPTPTISPVGKETKIDTVPTVLPALEANIPEKPLGAILPPPTAVETKVQDEVKASPPIEENNRSATPIELKQATEQRARTEEYKQEVAEAEHVTIEAKHEVHVSEEPAVHEEAHASTTILENPKPLHGEPEAEAQEPHFAEQHEESASPEALQDKSVAHSQVRKSNLSITAPMIAASTPEGESVSPKDMAYQGTNSNDAFDIVAPASADEEAQEWTILPAGEIPPEIDQSMIKKEYLVEEILSKMAQDEAQKTLERVEAEETLRRRITCEDVETEVDNMLDSIIMNSRKVKKEHSKTESAEENPMSADALDHEPGPDIHTEVTTDTINQPIKAASHSDLQKSTRGSQSNMIGSQSLLAATEGSTANINSAENPDHKTVDHTAAAAVLFLSSNKASVSEISGAESTQAAIEVDNQKDLGQEAAAAILAPASVQASNSNVSASSKKVSTSNLLDNEPSPLCQESTTFVHDKSHATEEFTSAVLADANTSVKGSKTNLLSDLVVIDEGVKTSKSNLVTESHSTPLSLKGSSANILAHETQATSANVKGSSANILASETQAALASVKGSSANILASETQAVPASVKGSRANLLEFGAYAAPASVKGSTANIPASETQAVFASVKGSSANILESADHAAPASVKGSTNILASETQAAAVSVKGSNANMLAHETYAVPASVKGSTNILASETHAAAATSMKGSIANTHAYEAAATAKDSRASLHSPGGISASETAKVASHANLVAETTQMASEQGNLVLRAAAVASVSGSQNIAAKMASNSNIAAAPSSIKGSSHNVAAAANAKGSAMNLLVKEKSPLSYDPVSAKASHENVTAASHDDHHEYQEEPHAHLHTGAIASVKGSQNVASKAAAVVSTKASHANVSAASHHDLSPAKDATAKGSVQNVAGSVKGSIQNMNTAGPAKSVQITTQEEKNFLKSVQASKTTLTSHTELSKGSVAGSKSNVKASTANMVSEHDHHKHENHDDEHQTHDVIEGKVEHLTHQRATTEERPN